MTKDGEAAELARWRVGRQSVPDWLASDRATPDRVRAMLVRALDRPDRGGAFGRSLAANLGLDVDEVYAQHYPRKNAKLAAQARARGDHRTRASCTRPWTHSCSAPTADGHSPTRCRSTAASAPTAGRRSVPRGGRLSRRG
jgi:hypothetical protein